MAQKKNNTKAIVESEATSVEVVVATSKKSTTKSKAKATPKTKKETKEETAKTKKEVKAKKETATKATKVEKKVAEKPKKETKATEKSKKKVAEKAKKEITAKKETTPKAKAEKPKKEVKKVEDKKNPKKEVKAKKEVEPIFKTPRAGSLAEMIINAANNKYPYRNAQGMTMIDAKTRKKLTDEEYAKVSLHRDICKELVRLSTQANNFPYSVLVYFAVGTDAHRPIAFNKGYKSINVPKAETILRWLKWFADYNKNPKFYACDKIVHAFTKLYNEYSKKDKDFKALMKQWAKMPSADGYKTTQFKTMKDFYQLLTKPLIITAEVDEKTGEETIVAINPNPLAEGNEPKVEPTAEPVASASCTTLVPYKHYVIGK